MPKISIALFGRNDNYGDNFLGKLKFSIKSIQRALKNIDYEIVLLDYNPPKDKPLLSECLSEFKNIKHVVFSHEDHLEFIDCHLRAGAILLRRAKRSLIYNYKRKIPINKIYKINFIGTFAANLSIKYSTGDYILSTGTDNIFPIQFGGFIDNLEPNILYRTWLYRTHNNIFKSDNISLKKFDTIKDKIKKKIIIKNTSWRFIKNRTGTIFSSAGNFILMDRNSWKETGGYLPTINPRPSMGDCQIVFHALAYNKKIKCANFPIFNICSSLSKQYKKFKGDSNYIVDRKGIKYNHKKEIAHKEWQEFRKWAISSYLKPNKKYFVKIDYKKRVEEIKKLFKSFLTDKFLIY